MKKLINQAILLAIFTLPFILSAQVDTLKMQMLQTKGAALFGVTQEEMIDQLMKTMPGLGSNSRDILTEQSVKAYMMPPRKLSKKRYAKSYALATCLEFYVNFNRNYKVNLSPEFIELNLGKTGAADLKTAFNFLAATGTVSAAIMPYESASIPAGVYATPKYKINNYLHVVRDEMNARQKIFQTRTALMRGNPVLIEMQVSGDFETISDTKFWSPINVDASNVHPFLVVGYDQELEAFEILSSWGSEWGHNGYLWVEYNDFGKYVTNGYVIVPEEY